MSQRILPLGMACCDTCVLICSCSIVNRIHLRLDSVAEIRVKSSVRSPPLENKVWSVQNVRSNACYVKLSFNSRIFQSLSEVSVARGGRGGGRGGRGSSRSSHRYSSGSNLGGSSLLGGKSVGVAAAAAPNAANVKGKGMLYSDMEGLLSIMPTDPKCPFIVNCRCG